METKLREIRALHAECDAEEENPMSKGGYDHPPIKQQRQRQGAVFALLASWMIAQLQVSRGSVAKQKFGSHRSCHIDVQNRNNLCPSGESGSSLHR